MLDAFIIEELKRREREEQHDAERPRPEKPVPTRDDGPPRQSDHPGEQDNEKPQRGVVIIDYSL